MRIKIEVAVLALTLVAIIAALVVTPIGNYIVAMFGGSIQYGHL